MPLSLRFQRKAVTVFLFVEPTDTFGAMKVKLAELLGERDGAASLRLVGADRATEYKDAAVASDFALADDALVLVCAAGEAPA